MRTLDRYLATEVLRAALLAAVALTALDAFFGLVGELEDLGRHTYGLGTALTYVALTLPRRLFQMLPSAALIGALVALGGMAVRSELAVMRAAGVSVGRIAWGVLKAGLLLLLLTALLGELVAPWAELRAQSLRASTQNDLEAAQVDRGFWLRDGDSYVHVRHAFPDGELLEVRVYTFDGERMSASLRAARARREADRWQLLEVERSRFDAAGVHTDRLARLEWQTALDPALLSVVVVRPEHLTALGLARYIDHLERGGEDARRYRQAFWGKLLAPLQGLVMLLVALPFVFGGSRTAPLGQRLVIGIVVGLLFHLLSRLVGQAGHAYQLDPLLSAGLPSLLFLGLALLGLRRVG
ncbi:MAG TPA: LPS export ABC transporter permease LptG [Gammaproteobacteria bacterium]